MIQQDHSSLQSLWFKGSYLPCGRETFQASTILWSHFWWSINFNWLATKNWLLSMSIESSYVDEVEHLVSRADQQNTHYHEIHWFWLRPRGRKPRSFCDSLRQTSHICIWMYYDSRKSRYIRNLEESGGIYLRWKIQKFTHHTCSRGVVFGNRPITTLEKVEWGV